MSRLFICDWLLDADVSELLVLPAPCPGLLQQRLLLVDADDGMLPLRNLFALRKLLELQQL